MTEDFSDFYFFSTHLELATACCFGCLLSLNYYFQFVFETAVTKEAFGYVDMENLNFILSDLSKFLVPNGGLFS